MQLYSYLNGNNSQVVLILGKLAYTERLTEKQAKAVYAKLKLSNAFRLDVTQQHRINDPEVQAVLAWSEEFLASKGYEVKDLGIPLQFLNR